MNISSIITWFRSFSLRNKLLLSILGITGLSVLVFGYFFYARTQQSQTLLQSELQVAVRQQSEQQLNNTVLAEARLFDQTLSNVAFSLRQLSDYQASLYAQKTILASGTYWDGRERLVRLPGGQFGNSKADTSSVSIPNIVQLSDSMIDDINLNIYLDFNAPAILGNLSDVVGLYYISEQGFTIYYPNIELAKIVSPDFDPRIQAFFQSATPQNNPDRSPIWIAPYQDPAGTGLIVTSSVPVYDHSGDFKGVLGADVQLATIAQLTADIRAGDSGFAFMIDQEGHLISMPATRYDLFGVKPEQVPLGETPKETLLGKGPQEFQLVTRQMIAGGQGTATVTLQDIPYLVAYAPLPTTGYSLGLIVPVAELERPYNATRDRLQEETQNTISLAFVIIIVILLSASAIGVFLSQTISRPLVNLTQVAEKVRSGNLDVQASIETRDEIGILAGTFNNMAAQLRTSFATLEQRIAERTKALATVAEVSIATSNILETQSLLQEVVNLTKERFNLYHSHIYLLDEAGENLVLAAGAGEVGRQMVAEKRSIPLGREQSLVARAARERKGVTVNDVTQEPDFLPNPLLPETRAELAVPMLVGGNVIGVFDIQSEQVGRFTEADISVQTTLAAQVAISIQNVRQFERSSAQAELETLVNAIGQKIQRTASVEEALQTAARELGTALGASRVSANIQSARVSDVTGEN